jgi:hypothetical protein
MNTLLQKDHILRDIRLKNNLKSDQIKFGQAFLFLEEVMIFYH